MAANPLLVSRYTLQLEIHPSADESVVKCHGRIIAENVSVFREQVKAILPDTKCLILDLAEVAYMDSDGLGVLVGIYTSAKRGGCELKLVNVGERVMGVLHVTRLDSLFQIQRERHDSM